MAEFIDRALSWGLDSLMREDEDMPDVTDLLSDDSPFWDHGLTGDADELFPEFDLATTSDDLSEDSMDLTKLPLDSPFSLPFEKRFEATKRSLEECMKKSQETRRSLTLTSPADEKMKEFLKKRKSVEGVVASVQYSARNLQQWVVPQEDDKRRH